ncbi:immunoglobulin-like domain-containing protein [Lacticaseibacillus suibinensis]|uniref:immunoglobulin-like domain-containing protein n=1 Tax=Lacticaseibacillus suibinensis TaxID=2486011 RepID=UPI000F77B438|nr:immunoglobulin-like domain-containing protein [Lacticaseibacillus suibinensis]
MDEDKSKKRKKIAAWVICPIVLLGLGAGIVSCQQQGTHKDQTVQVQKKSKDKAKAAAGHSSKQADKTVEDAMADAGLSSSDTNGNDVSVSDDGLVGENDLAVALNGKTTTSALALVDGADAEVKTLAEAEKPALVPPIDNSNTSKPSTGTGTDTGNKGGGSDSGETTTDQAPSISAPATMMVHKGQQSVDFRVGVTASDSEDGDLTNAIGYTTTLDKNTPGTYTVTYSVTDSAGHTVSVTRDITVINDKPSIVFLNDNPVEVGTTFDALKDVSADDYQDGDLTGKVTAEGKVDTTTPGQYELTYSVTDSDGQTVTKQRTVTVYADKPNIDTNNQNTSVALNSEFDVLQGVKATSKYGEADLKVDGNVDTSKPGENKLTYTTTDKFGQTTTKTVTINVTADKPSLDVSKVPTTLKVGDQLDAIANVTATSPYGDAKVTVDGSVDTGAAGDYKLTYTATDKFGQTTTKEVTVTVAADDSTDATEEE